ncbi:type VI secretion system protein TssR domain-containing protein [Dysgonomonas sp. ZJ709]|uniref:type VI secretion system protein TssR domain-containing protein n=1 Tax=Dysgonomonas sp. ZJ709 TaxID=2709797 RepID=UPI0013ED921A|nr:type VI secretion system protein TssR domain-containing protein [Dysgonomonas sp. ZJ709]
MSYKNTNKSLVAILFGILLLTASCGPVHRFTRVKKIPREYSLNYCGDNIKAPRTDLNKEPWVVFSDREKNQTFNNAGGNVKAKDVDYLDAFLVIGKKGDYLRLIKYTPDILKNGKLEYKKAEYYGWIHKSKLLLNQQSVTDIASGKKNKMLAIFTDTTSINEPEKFFITDSIKLYKDLGMNSQAGVISPYSIIYQLKTSEDERMTLIAKKPYIKADAVKNEILGWVDNSLIKDIGTGLHVNMLTLPEESRRFFTSNREDVSITEDMKDANHLLTQQYSTIRFNPVSSYSRKDSLAAFKTRMVLPVFDYSNNSILNVNGGNITHKQFRTIAKGLKKINICFVFEGKEKTISNFPQIVNALQGLQPLFEKPEDLFSFQFSSVMTFDDSNKMLRPVEMELTPRYSDIINYLSEKVKNKEKLRFPMLPRKWAGLRKAVDIFDDQKDATNLIVLIGETGYANDGLDAGLLNKLLKNNCRILGFQVYAGEGDEYNNFVLDIENMINSYADGMLKTKKDILVSPKQIKLSNRYKETGETMNSYRLDFPNNSITQGALFFPRKSEVLPMEVLSNNIDTIIQEIKQDNNQIIEYMDKAFRSVGNNRTRFDSLFVQNYSIDTTRMPAKKLIASFSNENPGWYIPSHIVVLDDTVNNHVDYRLMLSENELKELKEFVAALSEKEVDYIYQVKEREKQKRKPCNCPEDDLFAELEKENRRLLENDPTIGREEFYIKTVSPGAYANTNNVRKHLSKLYLKPIKSCKLCKEKNSNIQLMTLAEAQYRITGSPTSNELLNAIRIKDIKDKRIVTDKMLEELIIYYKKMKKELDKAEQFESNGQVYYWVDRKLLP